LLNAVWFALMHIVSQELAPDEVDVLVEDDVLVEVDEEPVEEEEEPVDDDEVVVVVDDDDDVVDVEPPAPVPVLLLDEPQAASAKGTKSAQSIS
jgi:hypothetical protein